jgi:hypothetical protein
MALMSERIYGIDFSHWNAKGSKKGKKNKKGKKVWDFALFVLFAFFASTPLLTTKHDFENVSSHQHTTRNAYGD